MAGTDLIMAAAVGLVVGGLVRLLVPHTHAPVWLAVAVGTAWALLGTVLTYVMGVALAPGIQSVELITQVTLAAIGVVLAADTYGSSQ